MRNMTYVVITLQMLQKRTIDEILHILAFIITLRRKPKYSYIHVFLYQPFETHTLFGHAGNVDNAR